MQITGETGHKPMIWENYYQRHMQPSELSSNLGSRENTQVLKEVKEGRTDWPGTPAGQMWRRRENQSRTGSDPDVNTLHKQNQEKKMSTEPS